MAKQQYQKGTIKVMILKDPASPDRGVNSPTRGKIVRGGETETYDAWTGRHLIAAGLAKEVA